MEEKVKVCVEIDKQANKLMETMGNEIVLDESLIDDKDKSTEMKFAFAAIAIGAAAKTMDAQERDQK